MGKRKWDGWLREKQGERKERRADFGVSGRIGFLIFFLIFFDVSNIFRAI